MPTQPRFGLQKRLHERYGSAGDALYTLIASVIAIAISGLAASIFRQPLLFPSIGPTLFIFFETPLNAQASPRNALIGHGVAIVIGVILLAATGLWDSPSVLQVGVSPARIVAAALSVGLTSALLTLLKAPHAPAGTTTLLVTLGLLDTPHDLLMLALGVILFTLVGWALNIAAGIPVPFWPSQQERSREGPHINTPR